MSCLHYSILTSHWGGVDAQSGDQFLALVGLDGPPLRLGGLVFVLWSFTIIKTMTSGNPHSHFFHYYGILTLQVCVYEIVSSCHHAKSSSNDVYSTMFQKTNSCTGTSTESMMLGSTFNHVH